jgi:hypothetical protein
MDYLKEVFEFSLLAILAMVCAIFVFLFGAN